MKWRTMPLEAIKAPVPYAFVGGPFGSNLTTRDYVEDGVPVIRGNNLPIDSLFREEDFVFVSEKKAVDLRPNTAYPGDLVFTQRGTLGQVGLIPREARYQRYILSQSQMKLTVNPEIAYAHFVYYFFRQPSMVQKVINYAITSGVPHINLGILKEFKITLPEIDCQKRAADILSAYDNLIDTNRRRIQLLEESAQLLFREWFVYFKFPNHKKVKIVDGIPKGWKKEKLIKIGYLNYGKALVEETREEGDVKVYGSSGVVGVHSKSLVEGPGIIVGRKGNVGAVHWVNDSYWPIDTVYYIKREQSNLFLYLSLKIIGFINTDASVPGLNRDYAHSKTILVPTKDFLDKFLNQVNDIYSMVKVLTIQSQKLAQIRDFLLPRLMSGAIEV